MKRQIIMACILLNFFACTIQSENKNNPSGEVKKTFAMDHPDYEAGLALVEKSDCVSCHKINEILVGPSYVSIAGKYESNPENISLLSEKILKGGQGVWGQVPMAAHPTVKKEDAEKMVKYILLLKP